MRIGLGWTAALVLAGATPLVAQTDYYNTDAGRPVRIEDAHPVERYAFELQLAPVRMERLGGGIYDWDFEPELAYGLLPGTQIEIAFPFHILDAADGPGRKGLAGLELSALHNLNAESSTLPAFALAADALVPIGGLAPDDAYVSGKAIATRTFRWARLHVNASYTFGPDPTEGAGEEGELRRHGAELSRWVAGFALDRAFPLQSALLVGALYAEQPLREDVDVEWIAEGGVRYQWSPTLAVDAGIGRRLTGDARAWSLTFGAAYAFALRSLMVR